MPIVNYNLQTKTLKNKKYFVKTAGQEPHGYCRDTEDFPVYGSGQ